MLKPCCIYCRVSTKMQKDEGTSLTTQRASCEEYARQHGYFVVKVVEEAITGTILEREGLDEIRDLAAAKEIEAVICHDQDRLSRVLSHTYLLRDEFESLGVSLLFVTEPPDDTPEGKMLFGMKGLFKEYERTKIRERMRRGKRERTREGKVMGGGKSPYGYQYIKKERRYELVEEEAEWVVEMFRWVAEDGASLYEVADRLNSRGVPTKQGAPYWTATAVRPILKNPLYAGTWYWGKTASRKPEKRRNPDKPSKNAYTSRAERPKEEWLAISMPVLVEQAVFDVVGKRLERNRDLSTRNAKSHYLLSGFAFCELCGRRLRGHRTRTVRYYECSGRHHRLTTGERCTSRPFNADRLEEKVRVAVRQYLTDPELLGRGIAKREESVKAQQQRDDRELKALYETEAEIKREKEKLLDLHQADLLDLDIYTERLGIARKKGEAIAKAKAEVLRRIEERKNNSATVEAVRHFAQIALIGLYSGSLTPEEERRLLDLLDLKGKAWQDEKGEYHVHLDGIVTNSVLSLADKERLEAEGVQLYLTTA